MIAKHLIAVSFAIGCLAAVVTANAGMISERGPRADLVTVANQERHLDIYGSMESSLVDPLIHDFEVRYPAIHVTYSQFNSTELKERYVTELAMGEPSADVLWSAAMDLQMQLAEEGYAASYRTPARERLPEWAVWNNSLYATSLDPAIFIYNKHQLLPSEVPQSHAELTRLLNDASDRYCGRITSYDPGRSNVGYLLAIADHRRNPHYRELVHSFGRCHTRLYTSSSMMLEQVRSGASVMAYHVLGAFILNRVRNDPDVGVVWPRDYTLALSRVILISRSARHPAAARLWVDYLLSRPGQSLLTDLWGVSPVREDMKPRGAGKHPIPIVPVPISPELLHYQEPARRYEFLRGWQQLLASPD